MLVYFLLQWTQSLVLFTSWTSACMILDGEEASLSRWTDTKSCQSPLMFHITDGSAITICRARWKWARKRIQIGPRGPGGPGGSCPPPQWSCRSSEWWRVQRSASSPRWPGNHLLLLKASRRGRHQLWANYIGSVRPAKNNLLREICRPAQTQTERWAGSGRILMDALCELSLVFYHFSCHWVIIWTKQATWRRHVLSVFYWVLQSTSSDFGWSFLGH